MNDRELRAQLLATARAMNGCGLNQGTSGNVSVRSGAGFLITPSALPYDRCEADDLVWLDDAGTPAGHRRPSSEWRMHRDLYRHYPAAGAILHAHSPHCTALACLERAIPPFHYMVAWPAASTVPACPTPQPAAGRCRMRWSATAAPPARPPRHGLSCRQSGQPARPGR